MMMTLMKCVIAGEDYTLRPTTWCVINFMLKGRCSICFKYSGLPTPVNDLVIMTGNTSAPTGVIGEVWVRGPNIMKEYWCDPGCSVLLQDKYIC